MSQIARDLQAAIAAGQHAHGDRLPSVRDLAAKYGVSHQTVAATYAALAALGLVRTGPTGTVVTAGRAADAHLGTYGPPDLRAADPWQPTGGGQASEATVSVRQVSASADLSGLDIPEGSPVVVRTRIRRIDDVPVHHKITVVPYEMAAMTPEGYEGVPPMLAPVGYEGPAKPSGVRMAEWIGWQVAHTDCVITAEPMSADAAEILSLAAGTPGFRIATVAKQEDGRTVYATVGTSPLHHRITLRIAEHQSDPSDPSD